MKKLDLILIGGFGVNHLIIKGAIDYYKDYFNVHFIDLPGSIEGASMERYKLKDFVDYMQKKIEEIGSKEYILAPLSFGFLISSYLNIDDRCKGILTVVPFINANYLKFSSFQKLIYIGLINLIHFLRLERVFWHSKILKRLISRTVSNETADKVINELNPRSSLLTLKIILGCTNKIKFRDLPCVLIVSETDPAIDVDKTIKTFNEEVEHVYLITSKISHFPKTIEKEYFKSGLDQERVEGIMPFFLKHM